MWKRMAKRASQGCEVVWRGVPIKFTWRCGVGGGRMDWGADGVGRRGWGGGVGDDQGSRLGEERSCGLPQQPGRRRAASEGRDRHDS